MSDVPESFRGFMAYYDSVHQHPMNRLFHGIAFSQGIVGIATLVTFAVRGEGAYAALGLVVGLLAYAWAWSGHFVFEKNRPATFHSPVRSLVYGFVWFFFLAITFGRGVRWQVEAARS